MKKILSQDRLAVLREGVVIPASPLALDENRKWDQFHQKLLYRYYCESGTGGVAVAVHSTQFEIRDKQYGLFEPVLSLASEELKRLESLRNSPILRIAGVCGKTEQALAEAQTALKLDYDAVLLSLGACKDESVDALLSHCRQVAEVMPVIGFYLQPDVGGRVLPYEFWKEFAEIKNVIAIKLAPFNRYRTIDAVRAVAGSSRRDEITLYTGNDDNIINDLLTPFVFDEHDAPVNFVGGLLGQWCVWTSKAVELLNTIKQIRLSGQAIPVEMYKKAMQLTDANAAVFDARNAFAGCIPGIHEVLKRQGLMATNLCLNPCEVLSEGQAEEIDRVSRRYPWLTDDDFVRENIEVWKREL